MCVAVVIESQGPSMYELLAMDRENPHGAGVAYAKGNRIHYHKGISVEDIFYREPNWPRPYLLHFRWATHGPRTRGLCHPFPLGKRALIPTDKPTGITKAVLIHNGVWHDYERHIPAWARNLTDRLSDTAVAAYRADIDEDVLDEVAWSTAVGRAAGRDRMDITMRGNWEEYNGNSYSNLRWLATRT